jgi:hypothetical protein
MTEIRYFCDKCGATILEARTLLIVEMGAIIQRRGRIDLCQDCACDLEGWLAARHVEEMVGKGGR